MTVYGRNSVEEALVEKLEVTQIYIDRNNKPKFSRLAEISGKLGIPVKYCDNRDLETISKSRKHQGIVAEIRMPANIHDAEGEVFDWSGYNRILALDGITDTGNLGAITRSALLFKIDAIVLPRDASARITPAAIRASAGAIYKQSIYFIDNINYFIEELKEEGFRVYGLAGGRENPSLSDADLSGRVCMVVGSEDKGIRKAVRKKCDVLLNIPNSGRLDSLNASVAAAIAMWEIYKADIHKQD